MMDKAALADGVCANPGPFKGAIDFFSLSSEAGEDQSICTTTEEYRRTISCMALFDRRQFFFQKMFRNNRRIPGGIERFLQFTTGHELIFVVWRRVGDSNPR